MLKTPKHEINNRSVALAGSIIGISSLFFGWLTLKPNRLAAGTSISLWDSFGLAEAIIILLLFVTCMVLSFFDNRKIFSIIRGVAANTTLILSFVLSGSAANRILSQSPEFTRISLSSGIFVSMVGAVIVIVSVRRKLAGNRLELKLISWTWLAILILFLAAGWFNNISVVQEFLNNTGRFQLELITHLILFGISIAVGTIIGIPLGIWAARSRRANRPIFFMANILETIPSLALFGLLITPLSALSYAFPILQDIGIRGIGAAPAIIALIIYALLPIIQNTYTGLHQINPAVLDVGLGMGMNRTQLLIKVEAPLAAPLILTGIRTSAVQTVGNTAVAALIGAGGLGQFIFQGLGQAAADLIILGAIPIILLALAVDVLMQKIVLAASPKVASGGTV